MRACEERSCQEEPSLLRERDVGLASSANAEVVSQLIERGTEARRSVETAESQLRGAGAARPAIGRYGAQ